MFSCLKIAAKLAIGFGAILNAQLRGFFHLSGMYTS